MLILVCVVAPELKVNIDRLSQTLEGIYSDNSLCQVNQTHTFKSNSTKNDSITNFRTSTVGF